MWISSWYCLLPSCKVTGSLSSDWMVVPLTALARWWKVVNVFSQRGNYFSTSCWYVSPRVWTSLDPFRNVTWTRIAGAASLIVICWMHGHDGCGCCSALIYVIVLIPFLVVVEKILHWTVAYVYEVFYYDTLLQGVQTFDNNSKSHCMLVSFIWPSI